MWYSRVKFRRCDSFDFGNWSIAENGFSTTKKRKGAAGRWEFNLMSWEEDPASIIFNNEFLGTDSPKIVIHNPKIFLMLPHQVTSRQRCYFLNYLLQTKGYQVPSSLLVRKCDNSAGYSPGCPATTWFPLIRGAPKIISINWIFFTFWASQSWR